MRDGRLTITIDGASRQLHPTWLRERSREVGDIDPISRQRLFEPHDGCRDVVLDARLRHESGGEVCAVEFSDGKHCVFSFDDLAVWTGLRDSVDALPPAVPWIGGNMAIPTIEWPAVGRSADDADRAALLEVLEQFHRVGAFVVTATPTDPGNLRTIAGRFGRISATNFGELFDVRCVVDPADLAYTSVGLSAHTDQPYRRPTPGIQFLHTLVNDAAGGESTLVDGLAAVEQLRAEDPVAFEMMSTLTIEYRYDTGDVVVVGAAPIIELDRDGALRQIRFSPRLDFPPAVEPDVLDEFFRARRVLAGWLNDPVHQAVFKMRPGDVLVVDNHRVLHGRRPFDPRRGERHLQGCYIDHDGPATMLRLLRRGCPR